MVSVTATMLVKCDVSVKTIATDRRGGRAPTHKLSHTYWIADINLRHVSHQSPGALLMSNGLTIVVSRLTSCPFPVLTERHY